jgi:hypothetical protein
MSTTGEVVLILQIALALGPVAVYLLALGLVNSRPHPCVVAGRTDYSVLAMVLVPLLASPLVVLAEHGWMLGAGLVVLVGAVVFVAARPRRDAEWVVYNTDAAQCERLLGEACRHAGWTFEAEDGHGTVRECGLQLRWSAAPWMRGVTLHLEGPEHVRRTSGTALMRGFERQARREAMLPSAMGAGLVLIGTCVLGIPTWYVARHMDAVVEVFRRMVVS